MSYRQIEEQIKVRKLLLSMMVGTTYPYVIREEIHDLENMLETLREKVP